MAMASEMMNEQLGATTHVEGNGGYVIRGFGCPLAALTGKHPGVCLAMESLVAEVVGAPFANVAIARSGPGAVLKSAVVHRVSEPTKGETHMGRPVVHDPLQTADEHAAVQPSRGL